MISIRVRFFAASLAVVAASAFAEDLVVTRYDDPAPDGCLVDDCSLREAVIESNNGADPDTILLSAGTYFLTRAGASEDAAATGDLDLKFQADLVGAGATMTTIDGGDLDRVLHLMPLNNSIEVRGISVVNGGDASGSGSAILSNGGGDLVLDEVYVHDSPGAGVAVHITLVDTVVHNTTIADNAGTELLVSQAQTILFNSTVSDSVGDLVVVGNDARLYCNHCTIRGGFALPDTVDVAGTGELQLANTALVGIDCDIDGTVTSFGGNLEATGASCGLDQASDQDGVVNHHFDVLGDNGGSTPTHMPATTSPAVGQALDAFCHDRDQRGATRPATGCDVGAVERVTGRPLRPLFRDGFLQGHPGAWSDAIGD